MKVVTTRGPLDFLQPPPCFGEQYAKTAPECQKCLGPVIVEGRLHLLREVCEARTKGAENPHHLQILTSREILARLDKGTPVGEIFREMLADNEPEVAGAAVRQLMANRFSYLKYSLEVETPDLPPTKELIADVQDPEVD